jgi:glycosyltransferase involved in cell wall biosynthesis
MQPVDADGSRPLWSVMIPTYNCARYLGETLATVLSQDAGPDQMQIEVVDDCSTDHPEGIVNELAPDRVRFYRQPANVGHVRNFNTCIERARGHLVHLLHGDDTVRDGFYRVMQQPFRDHPEVGLAFCRHIYMDASGHETATARLHLPNSGILEDAAYRITSDIGIQPPAVVVRRLAYEHLGGFDSRLSMAGEDLEMWTRVAACYPVWYEVQPLAQYHRRPASLISKSKPTGAAIRDYRVSIEIAVKHLGASRRRAARRGARRRCAEWALAQARELADAGDRRGTLVQLREALRSEVSWRVCLRAARSAIQLVPGIMRRRG